MGESRWFEVVRPGLADPVLDRRLRQHFEENPPSPPEATRRGAVFDLVTASKSPEQALEGLVKDPQARAGLVSKLDAEPAIDEIRTALIEVGRADEAQALNEDSPLRVGEFESGTARVSTRPQRRTIASSAANDPPPLDLAKRHSDFPTSEEGTTEDKPAPPPSTPAQHVASPASLSDDASRLEEVRLAVVRIEARIDHLTDLLKLTTAIGVGLLVIAAIAALLD